MITINLMPWREARRKRLQHGFQRNLAMSAIAGVGLVVLAWAGIGSALSGQDDRNAFLQNKIEVAQKEIEEIKEIDKQRERLLNRQKVIEDLQSNRTMMSHLLYDIASLTVDGVKLDSLKHQKNMLEIQGRATSNGSVSNYLKSLDRSEWMGTPELIVVAGQESGTSQPSKSTDPGMVDRYPYSFSLKTKVANPYAQAKADAAEAELASSKKAKKGKKKA